MLQRQEGGPATGQRLKPWGVKSPWKNFTMSSDSTVPCTERHAFQQSKQKEPSSAEASN